MRVGTIGKCTLTKKLSGNSLTATDILRDKSGHIINDENENIKTWANPFQNLLNFPSANDVPIAPTAGPVSCFLRPSSYDEILLALQ